MPAPTQGSGQTSDLRARLRVPETAQDTIDLIVLAYGETRHMGQVAERMGVTRRTLERAIKDFPDLKSALDKTREALIATSAKGT